MMNNEIVLGLITVGGGALGTYLATVIREKSETKRAQAATSGDVHKAELESDAQFMDRLIKRVELLEARQAEMEKNARAQDQQIAELKLTQQRIGGVYEANRKVMMRVARHAREGRMMDADTIAEVESIPEFGVLIGVASLHGPVES